MRIQGKNEAAYEPVITSFLSRFKWFQNRLYCEAGTSVTLLTFLNIGGGGQESGVETDISEQTQNSLACRRKTQNSLRLELRSKAKLKTTTLSSLITKVIKRDSRQVRWDDHSIDRDFMTFALSVHFNRDRFKAKLDATKGYR